jgi:hypothetical protein
LVLGSKRTKRRPERPYRFLLTIATAITSSSPMIIPTGPAMKKPRSMRTTTPIITEDRKVYVDGVTVTLLAERVEYLDANGKLVTETVRFAMTGSTGTAPCSRDLRIER